MLWCSPVIQEWFPLPEYHATKGISQRRTTNEYSIYVFDNSPSTRDELRCMLAANRCDHPNDNYSCFGSFFGLWPLGLPSRMIFVLIFSLGLPSSPMQLWFLNMPDDDCVSSSRKASCDALESSTYLTSLITHPLTLTLTLNTTFSLNVSSKFLFIRSAWPFL